jgi:uncharacterized protein (DUF983 family)
MPDSGNPTKGQPGIESSPGLFGAALFGLCPQCGAKGMFGGVASFAPQCKACGLDYAKFNVGDGPAAFLIMVIGAMVVGLALWVEFSFDPPIWVHVVLWAPVIAGATLAGLRITKAALLITEFRRSAREATGGDIRKD